MYYAMLLPLCGLTLLGAKLRSGSRKPLARLLVCLVLPGLIWLAACSGSSSSAGNGGGTPGTPPGTYNITVTATAGALQHTATVILTVQ
jgi:hypothetical protein